MTPAVFYLVLDYGKAGRESVIDWENCSKNDILRAIICGDYNGKLIGVHRIERDDNLWTDVSEDMANEVFDALQFEPHQDLTSFLQNQLGFERVNQLRPECVA